ncbi:MAG: hypothetical protein ACREIS_08200 [Nitrospiraceae bacterium]
MREAYTVIYRTGGRVRWTWRAMLDNGTREWANEQERLLEAQGYHGHVIRVSALRRHGLPETFDTTQSVADVRTVRVDEFEVRGELVSP